MDHLVQLLFCFHPFGNGLVTQGTADPDNSLQEDAQRYSQEKCFLDPVLESLGRRAENEVFFDTAAAGKAQTSLMELWRAGWEEMP